MYRKSILAVLVVCAFALTAVVASAEIIYSENFEGMAVAPLGSQGGWTTDNGTIPVGIGGALTNMQTLRPQNNTLGKAWHPLGSQANIDTTKITTLVFDAEHGPSSTYYSRFHIAAGGYDTGFGWKAEVDGWRYVRNLGNLAFISGGTDGGVSFKIVIDCEAGDATHGEVSGYYDFGSGWIQAAAPRTETLTYLATLDRLCLLTDSRTNQGGSGIGIDNIVLSDNTIPEPGTLVLLATGLIGLLCYAWRKLK